MYCKTFKEWQKMFLNKPPRRIYTRLKQKATRAKEIEIFVDFQVW